MEDTHSPSEILATSDLMASSQGTSAAPSLPPTTSTGGPGPQATLVVVDIVVLVVYFLLVLAVGLWVSVQINLSPVQSLSTQILNAFTWRLI